MTQVPTTAAVLAHHGYFTLEAAHADNVAFACLDCGTIASVTPTPTSTREQQRDLILWVCCDPADTVLI